MEQIFLAKRPKKAIFGGFWVLAKSDVEIFQIKKVREGTGSELWILMASQACQEQSVILFPTWLGLTLLSRSVMV